MDVTFMIFLIYVNGIFNEFHNSFEFINNKCIYFKRNDKKFYDFTAESYYFKYLD